MAVPEATLGLWKKELRFCTDQDLVRVWNIFWWSQGGPIKLLVGGEDLPVRVGLVSDELTSRKIVHEKEKRLKEIAC